jgi:hypothetical protein
MESDNESRRICLPEGIRRRIRRWCADRADGRQQARLFSGTTTRWPQRPAKGGAMVDPCGDMKSLDFSNPKRCEPKADARGFDNKSCRAGHFQRKWDRSYLLTYLFEGSSISSMLSRSVASARSPLLLGLLADLLFAAHDLFRHPRRLDVRSDVVHRVQAAFGASPTPCIGLFLTSYV